MGASHTLPPNPDAPTPGRRPPHKLLQVGGAELHRKRAVHGDGLLPFETALGTYRRPIGYTPAGVYSMRMARVNITMPGELHARAKQAGLNISQVAQQAVTAELTRLAKLAELDAYLAELETELGPISDRERTDAKAWADQALGAGDRRRSA